MERLHVPQGDLDLARYPVRRDEPLRAWDAADELVLRHLAGTDGGAAVDLGGTVVVVNDAWGALAAALAPHAGTLVSVSDSYLAHRATRANLDRNAVSAGVELRTSFDDLPPVVDVLVIKVPTSLALLEDQLRRLATCLHDGAVIVGAAMTRHLHTSTIDCFERVLGPTRTSLAQKKARLVLTARDEARPDPTGDPWTWPRTFTVDHAPVINHAGVFSAERLDIGTRFFLEHLPPPATGAHVVDLGCGNGVVGATAARANPEAAVTFIDESFRAVRSAEATWDAWAAIQPMAPARFVAGHSLFDLAEEPAVEAGTVDLVLNNPPFHADHAVGDAIAWQMFHDARAALRPGGELWVVGNRHLGYHTKLRRLFGSSELVASNAKFVVLRARR